MRPIKIIMVAGEASGDQRGAEVIRALTAKNVSFECAGIGGAEMRAAGVHTFVESEALAVMGFVEVIKHLPRVLSILHSAKKYLKEHRPDLLILVDYPGFNLRLAKYAKSIGIKVLFYISPQVWAWRPGRVKKIVSVVDHMAVILPFEKQWYSKYSLPVTYVGHPLVQKIKQAPLQQEARESLGLVEHQKIVVLCPGSRESELALLLPVMLGAAESLLSVYPKMIFVVAQASTIAREKIVEQICLSKVPPTAIQILADDSLTVMSAADVVVTASGTATLEAALLKKPMIVVYRVNRFTAWLVRRLIKIPYVSLCNIVAGERVVAELLQENLSVENVAAEVRKILEDSVYHEAMMHKFFAMQFKLADLNAAEGVADIVIQMASSRSLCSSQ